MAKIKAGIHHFRIIEDALKEVFNKFSFQARHSNHHIKDDKFACFYHLAVRGENGGWYPPDDRFWLNIPDCDGRTFTQINLHDEVGWYVDDIGFCSGGSCYGVVDLVPCE